MSGHGDLLDLLAADQTPIAQDDAKRIRAAILADGRAHDGRVDCNRVRSRLTNNGGHLDVAPRRVGPQYHGMVRSGLLRTLGYLDVNHDVAGRNAGRPAMAYELTEAGWSA